VALELNQKILASLEAAKAGVLRCLASQAEGARKS